MAISQTFTFGHSGGSVSLSNNVTASGDIAIELNTTVAGSTSNQLETLAFNYASVKGVYLVSDQTITLKTNSSGSPDNTITLTAGVPYVWVNNDPAALLFTANVTKFYLTNGGGTTANVYGRILTG